MNKTTANKAAKWWADQLRGTAKLDAKLDNSMVDFMARLLQSEEKDGQSKSAIDQFEVELSDILVAMNDGYSVWVGVDYHPDGILQDAAERAGLSLWMTTLPWKTSMNIKNGHVRVAAGYGADYEEL